MAKFRIGNMVAGSSTESRPVLAATSSRPEGPDSAGAGRPDDNRPTPETAQSPEGPIHIDRPPVTSRSTPFAPELAPGDSMAPMGASDSEPPDATWRPSEAMRPLARYSRFEILGRLARGGMADVFLARERALANTARYVALKRIIAGVEDDEYFIQMFLTEGRLAMGLNHPNICHVYDVGLHEGAYFISMEWVNGASLARLIRKALSRRQTIPAPVVARVFADLAAALHHAHSARDASGRVLKLVHRDVSPQNIMIGYDGVPKLLDFGIAKVRDSQAHTDAGMIKGKRPYMAPEQTRGLPLDRRTDVFALGVCLYEALTCRPLFHRETKSQTFKAVSKCEVPSIRDHLPDLPESLDHIVSKATKKRPRERFATAQEMQMALEEYLTEGRHLVNAARIADVMREWFAEEIASGPRLTPITSGQLRPIRVSATGATLPEMHEDVQQGQIHELPETTPAEEPRGPSRTRRLVGLGLAAAAVVAGVLIQQTYQGETGGLGAVFDKRRSEVPSSWRGFFSTGGEARGEQASQDAVSTAARAPRGERESSELESYFDSRAAARAEPRRRGLERSTSPSRRAGDARRESPPDRSASDRSVSAAQEHPSKGHGRLSINTRPWSRVFVEGRLVGTTPIGDVRVPAGRLRLRLEDRDGRVHRRTVNVQPSGHVERFFDLDSELGSEP